MTCNGLDRRVLAVAVTVVMTAAALTVACTEVRYVAAGDAAEPAAPFERRVSYQLERAFFETPPACVMVLPLSGEGLDIAAARVVEGALARHLGARVDRVVGPAARQRAERDLALDAADPGDLKRLARALRCDTVVEAASVETGTDFALIWAQSRLGLALSMRRAGDGTLLWRARHVAERADGGVPLSPLGLVGGAFRAGRLINDADRFPSMADDAARRALATLPDLRGGVDSAAALRRR